ncbi:MAG TPA: CRTAC1 family protein [Thermoanaerobaculia bacterium]|nr:CRTAC1 family protein [Thermoanaerobaculia bacterium]
MVLRMLTCVWLVAAPAVADDLFVDHAVQSGLDFVHFNGMSGELYFPEMMGQGGALLDYDGDGDLDAFFVQGAMLGPGKTLADALVSPRGPLPPRGRLYRNDLALNSNGSRSLRFVDVTEASGLDALGYGMGVATGDIDNDGWIDLYLTNYGPNQMVRNNGNGTFSDVTARTGTGDPRWSVSASFFDFDRDGWLDLYVANYVDFSVEKNPKCFAASSRRDYCGPADFPPLPHSLYRNRGDGTFEDVSARSGIARQPGPGLGVIAFDPDQDGWTDIYVANDGAPSFLWVNQRDGSFRDDALLAGAAVNRRGQPEAGMGLDAGDFDADGDEDIFITHLTGETNTLYVNDGTGMFEDRSTETGAAQGSLPFTSFGTAWLDYDNDGRLDLFIANGAVRIQETHDLTQTDQLYRNTGGRLEEVTAGAGPAFRAPAVGRGAAFGDVDNDGDTDILAFYNNGPARLLMNQAGSRQPWMGLRLLGKDGHDALGARIEVVRPGAATLLRRIHTDGSYASASDPRVLVGLGEKGEASAVQVTWPGGAVEEWRGLPTKRYVIRRDE